MHLVVRNVAVSAFLLLTAGTAFAQNNEDALFITVPNPLTSSGVDRISNQVTARRNNPDRAIRYVVFDFNPEGKPAFTTKPDACNALAKFIRNLPGAQTIAFVHGKVSGHTVLPVLACKELVMSKDASLGEIAAEGVDALTADDVLAYQLRFERPTHFAVVQKMYDRDVVLGKGVKNDSGNLIDWYVDMRPEKAADLKKNGIQGRPAPVPFAQDGQLGLFTAEQCAKLGLSKANVEQHPDVRVMRRFVAELYGLSPGVVRDDPLGDRQPEAYHYTLKGEVEPSMRAAVGRVLKEVKRKKGNVLFLTITCSGGDLATARSIADDLIEVQNGEDAILVVGFVPELTPDTGTIIAFGCSDIVMSKRKDAWTEDQQQQAEIGDFVDAVIKGGKPGEADAYRKSLKELVEQRGFPGVIADGMFEKDLEIIRAVGETEKSRRRLMTREEFDQANKDYDEAVKNGNPERKIRWAFDKSVKAKGQYLKLNATQAADLGVARFTVDTRDPNAVYALYGVESNKVREATPGWLDRFAEFIQLPIVTVLLVVIAFTGLILELKVPGLTVPGIIAALCFILVFWAHSRFSGEVFMLAILLFIMGLVLIGLEIFVLPGFGAPGIIGILLMFAGLGLVTFEKVPETTAEWGSLGMKVSQYMFAAIASFVLAFVIARFLPRVPYANRMMLAPPTDMTSGSESVLPGASEAASLLGAVGTANTPLRPAGMVRFADKFVDVVSDGGFIPAGARVQVVAVEGNRIVVKEV